MKYFDVDYDALFRNGKSLKKGNVLEQRKFNVPILLEGVVYKPFRFEEDKKARIILELEKLRLKHLVHVKGLSRDGKCFLYDYEAHRVLAKKLREDVSLDKRLNWIRDIIATHEELKVNNLLYVDYHSGNFLAQQEITFLDVDSIEYLRGDTLLKVIEEFLLELLISIYVNYDLTSCDDNCDLYYLFSEFFNYYEIIRRNKLDFWWLFEEMLKKSGGEIEEFRQDIKRVKQI